MKQKGVKMGMSALLIICLVTLGCIVVSILYGFKKGASGTKAMLLGISITLFGGILAVDPDSNLGGIEYLIVLLGLVVSIIGFVKKD